jgi:hypothetical protein
MEEYAIERAHDAFRELEIARKTAAGAVHQQSDEVNCDTKPTTYVFKNASESDVQRKRSIEDNSLSQRNNTELKPRYSRAKRLDSLQQQCEGDFETGQASDSDGTKGEIISEDNVTERQHHVVHQGGSSCPSRPQTSLATETGLDLGESWRFKQDIGLGLPGRPDLWDTVKQAAKESEIVSNRDGHLFGHTVSSGIWNAPCLKLFWNDFWRQARSLLAWTVTTSDLAVDLTARDSSFAVGKQPSTADLEFFEAPDLYLALSFRK